jgi:aminopeptidase N
MRRISFLTVPLVAVLLAGCTADKPPMPKPAPTAASPSTGVDYAQWSAGRSAPVADPIYPKRGNPGLDVLHYGLEVTWAPATKTFTGRATLQVRAVADLPGIALDFSEAYTVDEVLVDGTQATGAVAGEKLRVARPLAKDAFATLAVRYHGTPKTTPMPSHRGDAEALGLTIAKDGSLWTMQEPYGAFTWYPSNDQPSDKALYDIAITVPAGWAGIASGTPKGQQGDTFRYASTDPVASYLTTLAVGKYTKEAAAGPHGIPLTYWYRPAKDGAMMKLVRKSPKYLSWLERRFGPYPFPTGGVVLVASESGMETQQMITMGTPQVDKPAELPAIMDGDLLHEYAHQWFGDTVTPTGWRDTWLNEGWAMYAQLLYEVERDRIGATAFEQWFRAADARRRAKSGPPGKPRADSFAEGNVYICPALMLHRIHQKIGDKAFFSLARDWAQQNRNTNRDRAAFIAFVNKHTGKDFTSLINTWLDSPTTPQ